MDTQVYLAFTPKFPVDIAVMRFEKRYDCKPERIFVEMGLLKLGPEPVNKDKIKNEISNPGH